MAGAIAKLILKEIKITAHVSSVGDIKVDSHYSKLDFSTIEKNPVRCADPKTAIEMENFIKKIRKEGDTVGGEVSCIIENCPIGLGEPVFDKLHAELGKAMLSINAVKGFEYGSGFSGSKLRGSQHNDSFKLIMAKFLLALIFLEGFKVVLVMEKTYILELHLNLFQL